MTGREALSLPSPDDIIIKVTEIIMDAMGEVLGTDHEAIMNSVLRSVANKGDRMFDMAAVARGLLLGDKSSKSLPKTGQKMTSRI